KWGVAGLTASAGLAGWVEYLLLRRSLNRRIGHTGVSPGYLLKLWAAAVVAAAIGFGVKQVGGGLHAIPLAIVVLGLYGMLYFAFGTVLGLSEARDVFRKGATMAGRLTGRGK